MPSKNSQKSSKNPYKSPKIQIIHVPNVCRRSIRSKPCFFKLILAQGPCDITWVRNYPIPSSSSSSFFPEDEDVAFLEVAGGAGLHGGLDPLGRVVREVHFLRMWRAQCSSPTPVRSFFQIWESPKLQAKNM